MICCLGWGSLIWDAKEFPICSVWKSNGPSLPIEFTRQSIDDRITLVITPGQKEIPVLWAKLRIDKIEDAVEALAKREGISNKNAKYSIGHWSIDKVGSEHPETEAIGKWARDEGFTGVVWTALKPRFSSEYRTPAASEIVKHLLSLNGDTATRAEEYIRKTPPQIATEYRHLIEVELGWTQTP